MQRDYSSIEFLTGDERVAESMPDTAASGIFSNETVDFLNSLSKRLMSAGRYYPDVVTFGFWCRKSSVSAMREAYADGTTRLGKRVVFHIAPSNVPVNFAYSLTAGLLAGCGNIVRLPSKYFPQSEIIVREIKTLLDSKYQEMKRRICLIRYPVTSCGTGIFSSFCDMRVIWGGDKTIADIRRSPLKPKAGEITFADRHSLALIDSDEYIRCENKSDLARKFYNDTYFSDQNACTSPIAVVWTGSSTEKASKEFWARLRSEAAGYNLAGAQAVGKLLAFCESAISIEKMSTPEGYDPLVTVMDVNALSSALAEHKYNSGFFFQATIKELKELAPLCGERCQTISYFGFSKDELNDFVQSNAPAGVDRIVPIGSSMDFSLVWDRHDLIRELSGIVSVI